MYFYCSNYVANQFIIAIRPEEVWYVTNIPQTPKVSYCCSKLVTNVIRAVKTHYIFMIYHGCQPISIQGSNHPVYNDLFHQSPASAVTLNNPVVRVHQTIPFSNF